MIDGEDFLRRLVCATGRNVQGQAAVMVMAMVMVMGLLVMARHLLVVPLDITFFCTAIVLALWSLLLLLLLSLSLLLFPAVM